jgi:hypothetical protein
MTDPPAGYTAYQLSYSGRVQDELAALIARANDRGNHSALISAARAIGSLLRVYPQFGQPLWDLTAEPGQVWVGVVPPLVVRYVVFEDRRQVDVVEPMQPLPRSGFRRSRSLGWRFRDGRIPH